MNKVIRRANLDDLDFIVRTDLFRLVNWIAPFFKKTDVF